MLLEPDYGRSDTHSDHMTAVALDARRCPNSIHFPARENAVPRLFPGSLARSHQPRTAEYDLGADEPM
jgi:hypothetical protein